MAYTGIGRGGVTPWWGGVVPPRAPRKPAATEEASSAATGGPLFDYQPNSVVQGLDVLDRAQQGSVSTGTRRLSWAEIDLVAPGVTPESAFVFGRRYFSGLSDDGRFSTGARWVSSITERLEARTTAAGERALQHFSWLQPYNDPSFYYVEVAPASNVFVAPAFVGGVIVQTGNSYELTHKDGSKRTFVDSSYGIRVACREDRWGNETNFVYNDPPPGTGAGFTGGSLVITDSRGVSYTILFDSLGYITSLTDGLGHTWSLLYSTVGTVSYLTKVRYPVREVMEPNGALATRFPERQFTYSSNYRLHQVIDDANVAVLTNTYDPILNDKIATQTDGTGATWKFSEPAPQQTEVLNPRGFKRVYLHDVSKRMIELRQYQASFNGSPARTVDPSQYISWQFERAHGCNCGVVTKITEPDGGTMELDYSADLDLTEIRKIASDQLTNLTWKWAYDSEHRVASYIPPEGNAASDPAPFTTTITRQENAGILTRTTTIPARDWRTAASVWTDVVDSRGRLLESTGPSHDGSGTPSFLGKWSYHTAGTGILMPREVYGRDANTVAFTLDWDLAGRLTHVTDAFGHVWQCTYDPEGRPLSWTAPAINSGQIYAHDWTYDGNGRTARLRWKYYEDDQTTSAAWITWRFTHDSMGQLLNESRQLDLATPNATYATSSWTYDEHGNVLTATDADGYVSSAIYDERDLPWVMTDGVGTAEETSKSYEYNSEGRLLNIIENLDATRQVRFVHEYDTLDRLFRYQIVDALDPTRRAGLVETLYDSGSRIRSIQTMGVGSGGGLQVVDTKTFVYDDFHDSATRQVSSTYDLASGSLLRAVTSDFEYGPSGLPMRELTEGTLIAEYEYSPDGLPDKVQDSHGNRLELTYTAYGSVHTEVNRYFDEVAGTWLTTTRTFGHDEFGRATTITDSGGGVASQTHAYVFDSTDNVVKHTGPDGSEQLYQYRFDGALLREDAVIAGSTVRAQQYLLTPGGRQYKVIDDRNNAVDFIYDGRGRLKQEVRPGDGSTWTNEFNDANLITKITAPTGRTIENSYDWRGMISGTVYKDHQGNVQRTDAFVIDLGGFIKRATKTENGVTQYVEMLNDSSGRVLSETTVIPGLPTTTVQYAYDGRGRMQSITSPFGYQHIYGYDDRNRVNTVALHHSSEGQFAVADYDYLGTGSSVRRRSTGDGNQLDVSRDGHGRVTRMQTGAIANFTYGYDAANRVNVEMRGQDGLGDAYFYDGLGRLTKATRDSDNPFAEITSPGSTNHAFQREWLLDGDSHRTQVQTKPMGGAAAVDVYSVNGIRHHYDSITAAGQAPVSRAFDYDGRLTRHGNRYFEYDCVDNLVKVRDGQNTVAEYLFDALGRRVKKTAGGWDTHLIHAGPWVIEDYRRYAGGGSAWQLRNSYVHGPGIDNVVMMRHRDWVHEDAFKGRRKPQNLFLHQNKLGSTTAVTAERTGAVVESYRYDAYGKVTVLDPNGNVLPAPTTDNPFLFTGREYDEESGLYHYRARAYDPSTGSYLQEDPLGMRDGVNVVAYVNANPVNLSDPYGTTGIGETISNIMSFINNNRGLVAGLIMDLMGPLEGVLDLMSAATGKDITGWLHGGMNGSPESMGWWDRACAAAGAAVKIAAGGLRLLSKLKGVLRKIEEIVERAAAAAAGTGRKLCKLTGACFVAGTLVAMADGSFVPIEQVQPGQEVLCEQPSAVPGMAGDEQVRQVTDASGRVYEGAIFIVAVKQVGQVVRISGTPEHPIWCVNRRAWVPMGSLMVGDQLNGLDGSVCVVGRDVVFGSMPVHSLSIESAHSFRVSPLGVLVHNGCIVNEGGVKIHIYPKDHLPPHAHVRSGKRNIRIGQNGKPLKNEGELTPKERSVVDANLPTIRREIGNEMRRKRDND